MLSSLNITITILTFLLDDVKNQRILIMTNVDDRQKKTYIIIINTIHSSLHSESNIKLQNLVLWYKYLVQIPWSVTVIWSGGRGKS